MVYFDSRCCPSCMGSLRYYDRVSRMVRTKNGETKRIKIRRLKCASCNMIHRELPDYILPFKQYELDIIRGVIEGLITSDTLGFEDYPCEITMRRWQMDIFPTDFVL